MKRIQLAAALALCFGSSSAYSLSITNLTMQFYDADGIISSDLGGFNDDVQGELNSTNTGNLTSGTIPFFGQDWTASQEMYNDTSGSEQTWAGTSESGTFSYKYTLTGNQVAVGIYFNWSTTAEIAVLQIFDCPDGAPGACVGVHLPVSGVTIAIAHDDHPNVPGTVMGNGPFTGQHATFFGETADIFDADPIANDIALGALTDTANSLNVIANDTDFEDGSPPPAPPAVVTTVGALSAQNFALSANADGTITYTTTGGYIGDDSFQYTLTDSFGNVSLPATVSITVTATPNTPPVATSPTLTTDEDTPLTIGVTTVATDGDGDPLTYSFFDILAAPLGGAVTVDGTNTILTYTPPANVNGSDAFTYTANDGIADSNVGTITVTVNPLNDVPVCTDTSFTTDTNVVLVIDVQADLIANCTDIDDDPLTATIASQPVQTGSMVTDDGTGTTFTYTPATDLKGDDSFTYTVDDGNGGQVTATANIVVGTVLSNFTMLNGIGELVGGTNDVIHDWDQSVNTVETDTNFNMTIVSQQPFPFFGLIWEAHDIRVFGPGTYSFDTGCTVVEIQATGCLAGSGSAANLGATISMTVGPGQFGAHILFDWSTSANIDVVNVWDVGGVWNQHGDADPVNQLYDGEAGDRPDPSTTWALVSTDVTGYTDESGVIHPDEGDGFNASPMVDGPFQGFHANFNLTPGGSLPPKPPYVGTAPDTKLGNSLLASLNVWGLFAGLVTLIGLRRFSKK